MGNRKRKDPPEPVSRVFGFDRGLPVDRYYIESFLERHAADIHGRVMEIGDDKYSRRFGGSRISQMTVLRVGGDSSGNLIVGNLETGQNLPSGHFDCIVLTQTLNVIFDVHGAVKHLHQCLKPGGVLLATVPGISQISRYDADRWGDYWRFTTQSVQRVFSSIFGRKALSVTAFGNLRTATSFLEGYATEELERTLLDVHDPDYELIIAIRAEKY